MPPPPPPPPATSKSKLGRRGSTTPFPSLFERPFAWASPLTRSVPNSPPFVLSFFLACPSRSGSDLVPKRGEESCRSLAPPAPLLRTLRCDGGRSHKEKKGEVATGTFFQKKKLPRQRRFDRSGTADWTKKEAKSKQRAFAPSDLEKPNPKAK